MIEFIGRKWVRNIKEGLDKEKKGTKKKWREKE